MSNVKLRTDARENRNRILMVARGALAIDPAASLNSIAKTAGVGAGTLYRHFPNREALVLAVYRKEIDALGALAPELLSKHTPLHAFRLWCDRLAEFRKHGVADLLDAAKTDKDFEETYWPMLNVIRQFIEDCEVAGEINPGAEPEDILMLFGFLWRIPPTQAGETRVRRIIALIFRGLAADDPLSARRGDLP